ncbi:MAG: ATP-dependent Clp protease proteolytic subunit [Schaalia hyovaginalis]|uniref:ATP-dependent Clp protease proteolytic subunit n=1 Tax=Schaalia hyovaginalis TaxID=29316 RepID=UPI0026EFDBB7|nr:ATP-dependent Clp protease proteolytic subunit [Schaalia hyovaginalis]MDY3093792.1 ATP-dependent Clp protease proteolytic subunit [Schaalia hyovaginalis]
MCNGAGSACPRTASQSAETRIRRDNGRDKILTAPQAQEYGLIDQVLASRKGA